MAVPILVSLSSRALLGGGRGATNRPDWTGPGVRRPIIITAIRSCIYISFTEHMWLDVVVQLLVTVNSGPAQYASQQLLVAIHSDCCQFV